MKYAEKPRSPLLTARNYVGHFLSPRGERYACARRSDKKRMNYLKKKAKVKNNFALSLF
jgi:hypothetical protein